MTHGNFSVGAESLFDVRDDGESPFTLFLSAHENAPCKEISDREEVIKVSRSRVDPSFSQKYNFSLFFLDYE